MDEKIKEYVERLGNICGAAQMIKLGDELINEQKIIIIF